jgi:hypothetical protein
MEEGIRCPHVESTWPFPIGGKSRQRFAAASLCHSVTPLSTYSWWNPSVVALCVLVRPMVWIRLLWVVSLEGRDE